MIPRSNQQTSLMLLWSLPLQSKHLPDKGGRAFLSGCDRLAFTLTVAGTPEKAMPVHAAGPTAQQFARTDEESVCIRLRTSPVMLVLGASKPEI